MPHSNWWMHLNRPVNADEKKPIRRAAKIAYYASKYFQEELGSLSQEMLPNGSPLCMRQYGRMFGITRIPNRPFDHIHVVKTNEEPPYFLLLVLLGKKMSMAKIFLPEMSSEFHVERHFPIL